MTLRDSYRGTWAKGAYQCQLLKKEILKKWPILEIQDGLGACTDEEIDNSLSETGAPDLYCVYKDNVVCEIEVTGSDKLVPRDIWIGEHKVQYMRTLEDKDSYGVFFFYGKNHQIRYFLTAREILSQSEGPEPKTIRGITESYRIIDIAYMKGERHFWEWLQWRLELFLPVTVTRI